MSPSTWGPPTWIFMHTIAEKIKEESFPQIGQQLILILKQICNHLPCPECSLHAKSFWANVNVVNIKNKTDLINILYMFHNMVNKRKKTPAFNYDDLACYKEKKLVDTYNTFSRNFNTNGNMKLINESFHRNMMLTSLRSWLTGNLSHFNL
jgi:hypothetical protein